MMEEMEIQGVCVSMMDGWKMEKWCRGGPSNTSSTSKKLGGPRAGQCRRTGTSALKRDGR